MPARGTATSEHLAIYGLDATEKCVIAAVGSAQEADSLIRSAKRKSIIGLIFVLIAERGKLFQAHNKPA